MRGRRSGRSRSVERAGNYPLVTRRVSRPPKARGFELSLAQYVIPPCHYGDVCMQGSKRFRQSDRRTVPCKPGASSHDQRPSASAAMSPGGSKLLASTGKAVGRPSRTLRTRPRPRSHTHPPARGPSPLLMVPLDIIEEILLYLSGQDIIRVKQVR